MSAFLGLPEFIFNLTGKFSSAFLIFSALFLFLPAGFVEDSVINTVRQSYKIELWAILFFSGSLFFSYVGKLFLNIATKKIIGFIGDRQRRKSHQEILQAVINRLDSLDPREKLWIQFCLHNNQQTISCIHTDRTANSLEYKGVVKSGAGSVMSVPFTITDEVWAHLKAKKSDFLPSPDQVSKAAFEQALKGFVDSFKIC